MTPADSHLFKQLLEAVSTADHVTAKAILEQGIHPDSGNALGFHLLHKAVDFKDMTMTRLLLNYGADPNASPPRGEFPTLFAAILNDDASILHDLLKQGGDRDLFHINWNLMGVAIFERAYECLKLLIHQKFDPFFLYSAYYRF